MAPNCRCDGRALWQLLGQNCRASGEVPQAVHDPKETLGSPIVALREQQHSCLLDHLVRAAEQRERDGEAQRVGGLEVDDQLDFRG